MTFKYISEIKMAQLIRSSLNRSSLIANFLRTSVRTFSTPVDQPKQQPADKGDPNVILSTRTHKVNNFERKLLVFYKKYSSKEEVPSFVNQDVMEKVRNRFRILVANLMMLATLVGCIIMVMSGKKAVKKGESILKMNQDWHSEYQKQAAEESANKAKK